MERGSKIELKGELFQKVNRYFYEKPGVQKQQKHFPLGGNIHETSSARFVI
ncbi:hypothetical protein BLGI_4115 [Brevibacillus laterosporus GI-9]|nr:hypothetical protein BLGI_4115 [Brevibacillus laterosporus GI-9]